MSGNTLSNVPSITSAAELRRMAMQCATHAELLSADDGERDRLLKMQKALLSLAANEDWLDGNAAG